LHGIAQVQTSGQGGRKRNGKNQNRKRGKGMKKVTIDKETGLNRGLILKSDMKSTDHSLISL
jgi:hypothetical protein